MYITVLIVVMSNFIAVKKIIYTQPVNMCISTKLKNILYNCDADAFLLRKRNRNTN